MNFRVGMTSNFMNFKTSKIREIDFKIGYIFSNQVLRKNPSKTLRNSSSSFGKTIKETLKSVP